MQNEGAKILRSRFMIATTASEVLRHQSLYKPNHHSLPKWKYDAEVFTIAYATATENSYSALLAIWVTVFNIRI